MRRQPNHLSNSSIQIVGAGIAGTWQALLFAQAGCEVALYERAADVTEGTSHWAGGMLAPHCEAEAAEPVITRLGMRSLGLWRDVLPDTPFNGSLVVAHGRDGADFERFARLTQGHTFASGDDIARLEPDLAGRFQKGLFFPDEGHVDPRRVLPALHAKLRSAGVAVAFDCTPDAEALPGIVIDCRGLSARDAQHDLRGVKGETVLIETPDVTLSRPVRLIHPRWPLYVIPRADHRFLIGASSIECEDRGVSVRSVLELLTGAATVHPAFLEARVVEIGAGLRPAFPDNLPRIDVDNRRISVNGLYRHGFLLAPALAELTVAHVLEGRTDGEVIRCA